MQVRNHMAILRNLRNIEEAEVDKYHLEKLKKCFNHESWANSKVLPFRFIAAAKHAPKFESEIEQAMFARLAQSNKLSGKTVVIIDVSGSMYRTKISAKSEMDRANAACAMAMLCREVCEDVAIYATAGNDRTRIHQTEFIPSRRGFSLSDAIYNMCKPLGGGGIFLKQVMDYVFKKEGYVDRVIIITDEQDCSRGGDDAPSNANIIGKNNYMINVASYKNGIGYGKWTKLNGFSEAILDYIYEFENIQQ